MHGKYTHKIIAPAEACRSNQNLIMRLLAMSGPMSSSELARQLGVPPITVSRLAGNLVKKRALLNIGRPPGHRMVGKPPMLIDINSSYAGFIGVEITSSLIRMIYSDFKGAVIKSRFLPLAELKPNFQAKLAGAIEVFRDDCFSEWKGTVFGGIAVGVCGIMDLRENLVFSGTFPNGFRLAPFLKDRLKTPVIVENDANLALFGELKFGAAGGYRHVFCLFDRGLLGSAIAVNGELYKGARGMAGELMLKIRHTPGSSENGTNRYSFIEHFGLEKKLKKAGKLGLDMKSDREEIITGLTLKAEQGSRTALDIIKAEARSFAGGFSMFASLLDPDLLLLCGDFTGTGKIGETAIKRDFEKIFQKIYSYKGFKIPSIVFGKMGRDTVARGAVALLIERMTQKLISERK